MKYCQIVLYFIDPCTSSRASEATVFLWCNNSTVKLAVYNQGQFVPALH